MASKDLYNNISVVRAISPGVYENGVNPDGQTIDTQGYESVTLVMTVGAATDTQTLTLEHSVDDNTYNTVLAADVIADPDNTAAAILADMITVEAGDADSQKVLGYKGGRRYLQIDGTGAGGTGANFGVIAILGHGQYPPTDRS